MLPDNRSQGSNLTVGAHPPARGLALGGPATQGLARLLRGWKRRLLARRAPAPGGGTSIALGLLNSLREPLAYVYLQDGLLVMTGCNPALERLLERTSSELNRMPLMRILDGADVDLADRIGQAIADGNSLRCRAQVLNRFGNSRAVVVRVEPVAWLAGSTSSHALVYLDPLEAEISHLRLIASQYAEAQRGLAEQTDRLTKLQEELNAFGSMLSHDLRAPLRTIDGFARILAEDHSEGLDPFAREHLNRIQNAGARMNRMIDAFRDLSQLSARSLVAIPVDFTTLARDVAAELLATEAASHAQVRVDDEMQVTGDPSMLRPLLVNLIGNALKFSGRREMPMVRIGQQSDPTGRKVYFVCDNGEGFDMRFSERLFGAFQRLHSAADFPGTGVGLAIARRIVRRHHGEIWARGQVGQGACFYFTLPGR